MKLSSQFVDPITLVNIPAHRLFTFRGPDMVEYHYDVISLLRHVLPDIYHAVFPDNNYPVPADTIAAIVRQVFSISQVIDNGDGTYRRDLPEDIARFVYWNDDASIPFVNNGDYIYNEYHNEYQWVSKPILNLDAEVTNFFICAQLSR